MPFIDHHTKVDLEPQPYFTSQIMRFFVTGTVRRITVGTDHNLVYSTREWPRITHGNYLDTWKRGHEQGYRRNRLSTEFLRLHEV